MKKTCYFRIDKIATKHLGTELTSTQKHTIISISLVTMQHREIILN